MSGAKPDPEPEPGVVSEGHHLPNVTRRLYDVLRRLPHLPLNTRRGIVLFALLVSGTALLGIGGVAGAVHYSESTEFCGQCHTMDPEQKGLAAGAHANVTCAECHVGPGVGGFLKAKINGTKQLIEVVTGTFPTPIPPPDHAELPSVHDTCMECHSLDQITRDGGPTQLVLRPTFAADAKNTRTTVAVLLRPAGIGSKETLGVHWHVQQEVTFVAEDEHRQKIDLVEFRNEKGEVETYIAGSAVKQATNVAPDVKALKEAKEPLTMDCLDCHNRVGHATPNPEKAVDEAMAKGTISPELPFAKRDVVAVLTKSYANQGAADKAIDGLRTTLAADDPKRASATQAINAAVSETHRIYNLVATPSMGVTAQTYPDNLGHQSAPGCFRCHDGAHYLVKDGVVTNTTIPSTCNTCHTFPQAGLNVSNVPLGAEPASHVDKLFVFNHKSATSSTSPSGTSCGTCHAPTYCAGCHDSGAIKVKHDTMLYNHAQSVRDSGGMTSCAYCHQPAYCAQCHKSLNMAPNPLSHLTTAALVFPGSSP